MNWYQIWQQRHVFEIENNVLKKKQLVFTPFIKVNQEGFLAADFRPYLYADSLARYYRFKDLNVLANIGFNTLAYSSFMLSKQKSKVINNRLVDAYVSELEKLNVGYPKNKLVDTREKNITGLIEECFLYLYEKGFIKYEDYLVYKDKNDRIYDEASLEHNYDLTKEKVFVLDCEKYISIIVEKIKNLSVDAEVKKKLLSYFKEYTSLLIELKTRNNKIIKLYLKKPEELGALSAIIISPEYLDILEYIAPEEIFAVENFLLRRKKLYLYTGNYVINPLTGKEVPIFISFKFNEPFKALYSTTDAEILYDLDIPAWPIYEDGHLINSDFLNGLTGKEARQKIVDCFCDEGMAHLVYSYAKTKFLISSNDTYGCPIPLEAHSFKSLKEYLPIYFTPSFNKVSDVKELDVKTLDLSINSLFSSGLEIILAILADNLIEVKEIFNKNNLKDLKKWLSAVTLVINKDNLLEELLMPLIILVIISEEEQFKLESQLEIILLPSVYDSFGNKIKKSANNCIRINDIIASYSADAIRLYYLATNLDEAIYFDENKIFAYKQFLNKLKAIYNRGFLTSNYNLEFPLYQLKNKLYDALVSLNIALYIKYLKEFVEKYLENETMTKKQASEFLILLSVVTPYFAEEMNNSFINNKELLSVLSWPL